METLDGSTWQPMSQGTTIGYAKIDRIAASASSAAVRVTIEEAAAPIERVTISVYEAPSP